VIIIRHVPRSRDDQLLRWLRLRSAGWSAEQIARRYGVTNNGSVISATENVRDADLAESGDPEEVVMAAYDWRKKNGAKR
jgi:hypothetical protein